MKAPQKVNTDYIFTTNVSSTCQESDFFIEFFPYAANMECTGEPSMVIRNFEELIDLFEDLEENAAE